MKKLEKLTLELKKEIQAGIETGETNFKKISILQCQINEMRAKKMDQAIKKQNFDLLFLPSGNNTAHLSYLMDNYETGVESRLRKRKIKFLLGSIVTGSAVVFLMGKVIKNKK